MLLAKTVKEFSELMTNSMVYIGIVFACVVVLIIAVLRITKWIRDGDDPAETERLMLTQIADLHRQGELSGEEFRSIKGQLVGRLKNEFEEADPQTTSKNPNEQPAQTDNTKLTTESENQSEGERPEKDVSSTSEISEPEEPAS